MPDGFTASANSAKQTAAIAALIASPGPKPPAGAERPVATPPCDDICHRVRIITGVRFRSSPSGDVLMRAAG